MTGSEIPNATTLTAKELYNSILREYPDILNVQQVCEVLNVSKKAVYRLLDNGSIRSLTVGREYRIPKLYLLHFLGILTSA